MDFIHLCKNSEEVTIQDGVAEFTGYNAERNDYHTDRAYWVIPFTDVVEMVKNHMEEFSECETDEERIQFLQELGGEEFNYGGNKSSTSDYDTLSYLIPSLGYEKEEELEKLEDYTEFCYVEDYPYRYGTYSGVYNLKTEEIVEFYIDGDSSPCGGSDYSGFNVTPLLLEELMGALS